MIRKQRENELLAMAAGKLKRVLRRAGIVWRKDGSLGVRSEAVRELLEREYRSEDAEAERREKRGRKRLRESMSGGELWEEIRELLWDLWEEGQKPVGLGVGGEMARKKGYTRDGRRRGRIGEDVLLKMQGRRLAGGKGVGKDGFGRGGLGGGGGDQEAKKRMRRALRLRGWVGGLENPRTREVMGKQRPAMEIGLKKMERVRRGKGGDFA